MTKLKFLFFIVLELSSFMSFAGVNLKNGNFYLSWTYLVAPGGGSNLELTSTYNSKSTEIGWFGFGRGSEYETNLELSADGSIIIHEFGAGALTRFVPTKPVDALKAAKKIIKAVKKTTSLTKTAENDLIKKLKNNVELRHSYSKNFGVEARPSKGTVLKTADRGAQKLYVDKSGYRRVRGDGQVDYFDSKGKLVKIKHKDGYAVEINYKNGKVESIKDSQAKQVYLSWYPNGYVKEAWSAGDKKAYFKYKGDDLIYSKDVQNNEYNFAYDSSHNLTKVTYSDKSTMEITYDPKTFFVTKVKERGGDLISYTYGSDKKNPDDHYWTIVKKPGFDGKMIKNRYEYEIKTKPDGERYTYRIVSDINGFKTETVYNGDNYLPEKISRGKEVTRFNYNKKGLLTKKWSTGGEKVEIKYDKNDKIVKVKNNQGVTGYKYNKRGKLIKAVNKSGKNTTTIALIYNTKGKISKMIDRVNKGKKRTLSLVYNSLGKPDTIKVDNVGKIKFFYDNYGEIKKVDAGKGKGRKVASKVASEVSFAFRNLLTIIKPSGVNLGI